VTVAKSGKGDGKTCIINENEHSLVHCAKIMEMWGFVLTREEILDMVQTHVKRKNIQTRFKNGLGEENDNLLIKKPQGVEFL